jgi:hypothetical protein
MWAESNGRFLRVVPGMEPGPDVYLPAPRNILLGMWLTRRETPLQLARAAIWGVVIYTLTLSVVVLIPHRGVPWIEIIDIDHGGRLIRFCITFALALAVFAPGVIVGLRAVSLLREGIRQERWQEEQVEALRKHVDRPIWTVVRILLLALIVLALLLAPRHSIFFSAWLFLLLPVNLIGSMRASMRKPVASSSRMIIDWTTAKPLQSEHWGHVPGRTP